MYRSVPLLFAVLVVLSHQAFAGFDTTKPLPIHIKKPDCHAVTDWAHAGGVTQRQMKKDEHKALMLSDLYIVPIFGISYSEWNVLDMVQAQRYIGKCRVERFQIKYGPMTDEDRKKKMKVPVQSKAPTTDADRKTLTGYKYISHYIGWDAKHTEGYSALTDDVMDLLE